jgi:DNA-binding NarL/FixJ family response regulator
METEPPVATAPRVLLVVQDLFFEAKIGEVLRTLGRPFAVAKSEGALGARLAEGRCALAFVDYEAKAIPGATAIERIRAAAGPAGTRIVAFISHVRPEERGLARALGADEVHAKSALVRLLPELVERYAGGTEEGSGGGTT